MRSIGNEGSNWSSTVSGISAYFLGFYYDWIYPSDVNSRAYGLQVRCLRE